VPIVSISADDSAAKVSAKARVGEDTGASIGIGRSWWDVVNEKS
jgi:hypothetical protein